MFKKFKRMPLNKSACSLECFCHGCNSEIRAYDSERQNKSLKITKKTDLSKYHVISAYYHDNFIAVYVRKSPKKGRQSK